jgi:uncharacterized protein Yka (UPF0111/DUF47 family)
MFSLQKLLGQDDKFFTLLEASAEECRASVEALKRIVTKRSGVTTLDEFVESRRKDKAITAEINQLLCRVSVTALDREDIEALSNALYKIPKTVEKFAERYLASATEVRDTDFGKQVELLEKATVTLVTMLKELQQKAHLERLAGQNEQLQKIEGDADELILDTLKELYSRKYDPIKVIILKDLYELLEKVVDRCRDAGNVISHIVIKNS